MQEVHVYPRQSKKVDGLTESQLGEALTLYTNHVKETILGELEEVFGICLDLDESGEIYSYLHYAMDRAMTEGMELAANRHRFIQHYEKTQNIPLHRLSDYDFRPSMGVSGVLLPNGVFMPCGNAEHHLLMEQVGKEQSFGCIYFSSTLTGGKDGIISIPPVQYLGTTDEQRRWMNENKQYWDKGQVKCYQELVEKGLF